MIKFRNLEYEDSAIIYQTTLEQIKKLYTKNPLQAGELAIAAIEVALTGGEHSSDDDLIDLVLEQNKFLSTKNIKNKQRKADAQREKRIDDLKLREIVELLRQGFNQTQIGGRLGVSKQTISKRVIIIRSEFPELLSTGQSNLVDDNLTSIDSQLSVSSQLDEVDDNLTQETLVDEDDNLTTEIDSQPEISGRFDNQVNKVNLNVNVNDNVNVNVNMARPSSNEEVLPEISLEELNLMGAVYKDIGGGVIEFPTGKKMRLAFEF